MKMKKIMQLLLMSLSLIFLSNGVVAETSKKQMTIADLKNYIKGKVYQSIQEKNLCADNDGHGGCDELEMHLDHCFNVDPSWYENDYKTIKNSLSSPFKFYKSFIFKGYRTSILKSSFVVT